MKRDRKPVGRVAGLLSVLVALWGAISNLVRRCSESESGHGAGVGQKLPPTKAPEARDVTGRAPRDSKVNKPLARLCSLGFVLVIVGHLLAVIGCACLAFFKKEPLYLWELSGNVLLIAVLVAYRLLKKSRKFSRAWRRAAISLRRVLRRRKRKLGLVSRRRKRNKPNS